jgi:hypothetical protein
MADETAPRLPYTVEPREFGPSSGRVTLPVKVRDGGMAGDCLTADEAAVWAYVKHLEAENARLRAAAESSQPGTTGPKGRGKK